MLKPEPFGYFRAEPFGWTDCAETDDGAVPLFDHAAIAELEHNYASLQQAFEEMKAIAAHRLAAMKEAESQRDTFASHGHRLALELECLLMDTKDLPTVSRWWYTGMSALTNWQNLFPYDGPRIGE